MASETTLDSALFDIIRVAIVALNNDLCVTGMNVPARALFGIPAGAPPPEAPLEEFFDPPAVSFAARLREAEGEDLPWSGHLEATSRSGTPLNCAAWATPIPEGGILMVFADLLDPGQPFFEAMREAKYDALRRAIAGISHELNNPLTGIVGYSQLMLNADIPASVRSRLDQLALEARRCQQVVQNLRTFSERQPLDPVIGDINELVNKTLSLQTYQLETDGIELEMRFGALPKTLYDAKALQQVLLRLLSNAHHALRDSPASERRMTVETFAGERDIYIRLENNGPPLPPDVRANLFDPFYTTRAPGEATGLGLSVALGLVQDHGGDIRVHSGDDGVRFIIRLPVRTDQPLSSVR